MVSGKERRIPRPAEPGAPRLIVHNLARALQTSATATWVKTVASRRPGRASAPLVDIGRNVRAARAPSKRRRRDRGHGSRVAGCQHARLPPARCAASRARRDGVEHRAGRRSLRRAWERAGDDVPIALGATDKSPPGPPGAHAAPPDAGRDRRARRGRWAGALAVGASGGVAGAEGRGARGVETVVVVVVGAVAGRRRARPRRAAAAGRARRPRGAAAGRAIRPARRAGALLRSGRRVGRPTRARARGGGGRRRAAGARAGRRRRAWRPPARPASGGEHVSTRSPKEVRRCARRPPGPTVVSTRRARHG
jgi:hypothetical protein